MRQPNPSEVLMNSLRPQLAAVAQAEYDQWDEDDIDTFAGGGICHFIAEKLAEVLDGAGIQCGTVSSTHEQHVYVVAVTPDGVYEVDVPYRIYETGGGFSWKKIPDVKFVPEDISIHMLDSDPGNFAQYTDWEN